MIEHDVGVSTILLYPVKRLIAVILKRTSNNRINKEGIMNTQPAGYAERYAMSSVPDMTVHASSMRSIACL